MTLTHEVFSELLEPRLDLPDDLKLDDLSDLSANVLDALDNADEPKKKRTKKKRKKKKRKKKRKRKQMGKKEKGKEKNKMVMKMMMKIKSRINPAA